MEGASASLGRSVVAKDGNRLTDGINILSWDCGISNLCYCLIEDLSENKEDSRDYRIVMWENFSLNSQTLKEAVGMLVKELDKRAWMMNVDFVCIESQTLKNVQMKVISHTIQCYFETRSEVRSREMATHSVLVDGSKVTKRGPSGPPVNFIKPENKFKVANGIKIPDSIEKLQRRRRNKKAAVFLAETILESKQRDSTALGFLRSFEKQDDLSDSFLQAVYFLGLMRQKKQQNQRLKSYLGVKEEPTSLTIEASTGTKDEKFDEGLSINEGCEYEHEVPLPQVYRCENFVVPDFHGANGDISRITRFVRKSKKDEK